MNHQSLLSAAILALLFSLLPCLPFSVVAAQSDASRVEVTQLAVQTDSGKIDFNKEIRPILAEYCYQCHGPDVNKNGSGLRLDIESEAKQSAIVAGSPETSPLVHRVESSDVDEKMPPAALGKSPSEAQKRLLRNWIQSGAKYADHWAFQPIGDSSELINEVKQAAQSSDISVQPTTNPIDQFLLIQLSRVGLSYSPSVSKQQFIRRATFDLTGLPPSWQEIEQYVNDTAADADARLIDRLLASQAYGQRWGRHWLDIARYADTHGGAAIGFTSFPFSYTYRDYVIAAMNRDLPLDRFILEQIAADQLGLSENDPALAAVGFLTVGMQFRNYHDTIDDQIDVVTRGLMGLTVTCARCHDHKFDPISTQDYYSLYATIAASETPQQTQMPIIGEVSDQAQREAYQKSLADLKHKHETMAREQGDVLRNRLRMQVGLYLTEIAKGAGEQDVSTQFLSYRTDDIRPIVLNRWLKYLSSLTVSDSVFGPWLEMHSWGKLSPEQFQQKRDEYIGRLMAELEKDGGKTPEKLYALRAEPPKWNPFILEAIVAKKPASRQELAAVYGSVFADHQRQWLQALLDTTNEAAVGAEIIPDDHPKHQVINSPSHRQLRHHLYSPGTPFDLSDDETQKLTNRTINDIVNGKRGAIHQLNLAAPGSPPRAMTLRENPKPNDYFVFLRGNPLARGAKVAPGFLSVLDKDKSTHFDDGKRRMGLAKAVIDQNNPLTRRVIVNWAWQNHFGVGLVRTPDDFGTRGQSPTNPQLLDYLADQLSENAWSLKWLHRQIMLSQAYRQAAVENEQSRQVDPENLLLWRMPRKRLEFESMRDAMLAVTGELDTTLGGRPIDLSSTPTIPRRSVYGFVNRDIVSNLMSTFDVANPNACTAKRPETSVPQQTLFALNSDFIQDRAAKLAELTAGMKLNSSELRIAALVQRILGRQPTDSELDQMKAYIAQGAESSWTSLAHALLASNEFVFLD
ncbi:MAG: PSD1 and planctomycete cytochrome C domain-containing protein [Pirellulales bacterium]